MEDVTYSEPKSHLINFYFEGKLIHRLFDSMFNKYVFIPVQKDQLSIKGIKYTVTGREIKYLSSGIVVSVYLREV